MAVNAQNIRKIMQEIQPAALVAATKYAGVEDLRALAESGVTVFGENRVQAFLEKYEAFEGNVQWHIIGTLQSNKVKYIIDKVAMIHSVDCFGLLNEIQKQALKHGITMQALLQVNIACEESKHGFKKEEIADVIRYALQNCPNVNLRGLMMMAPKTEQLEETRQYFRATKALFEEMKCIFPEISFDTLSMGMSNDYKIAVEEGSTYVRIGRKLFD